MIYSSYLFRRKFMRHPVVIKRVIKGTVKNQGKPRVVAFPWTAENSRENSAATP